MPIKPFQSDSAVLTKSPRYGAKERFSTGNDSEEIIAWEVWNSRIRRQVTPYSKIINDETVCVLRTHNPLAKELETDDGLTFQGYAYSVQSVQSIKTGYNLRSYDYEVSLK